MQQDFYAIRTCKLRTYTGGGMNIEQFLATYGKLENAEQSFLDDDTELRENVNEVESRQGHDADQIISQDVWSA